MNIDEEYTLRDYQGSEDAEVTVTERQYRACVLDFLRNDNDEFGIGLWAGKVNLYLCDGWGGPDEVTFQNFDLLEMIRRYIAMGPPEQVAKKHDDFEDMLVYFLQTRLALLRCLELLERAIDRGVSRRDDGS